jgi:hypothetical protein
MMLPATPVIFVGHREGEREEICVVLLMYGNGVVADTIRAAFAATGVSARAEASHDDDMHHTETAFYVTFFTESDAESHALVATMMRSEVPVNEPFFFSCIADEYTNLIISFATDVGAALELSGCYKWEAAPTRAQALLAAGGEIAASAASPSSPLDAGVTVAPLRIEHVQLVVDNW